MDPAPQFDPMLHGRRTVVGCRQLPPNRLAIGMHRQEGREDEPPGGSTWGAGSSGGQRGHGPPPASAGDARSVATRSKLACLLACLLDHKRVAKASPADAREVKPLHYAGRNDVHQAHLRASSSASWTPALFHPLPSQDALDFLLHFSDDLVFDFVAASF